MTALTTYIGTKIIQATPMLGNPKDSHTAGVDGYQVVYEDGYTSWSPKEVFDRAYRKTDAMTFGDALIMLEAGKKVARAGWNGKGMWLALVDGPTIAWAIYTPGDGDEHKFAKLDLLPWIGMKTADLGFVPWLASQTDMLAKDWQVVE